MPARLTAIFKTLSVAAALLIGLGSLGQAGPSGRATQAPIIIPGPIECEKACVWVIKWIKVGKLTVPVWVQECHCIVV